MNNFLANSFIGPWVSMGASQPRRQHVYLTLSHWYESAKFMPHAPVSHDRVLYSPTVKEARKYARLHDSDWRSDWNLVQHNVMLLGLGLLAIQCPDLGLRSMPLRDVGQGLLQMDLPKSHLDACLKRFDEWRKGQRVAFIGTQKAPEDVVGQKISKVVANLPNWTLVTTCCGNSPWRVHDWALSHFVPVEYKGRSSDRVSKTLLRSVVEASEHVVIFEAKGDRKHDHVIQMAKDMKKKITLDLYDPKRAVLRSLDLL